MSEFDFKITRRVEFADTDMEGIMHFSNFFRFMEMTEHAFLRSLGYSAVLSRNGLEVCLPRVHAECDYLAPLRFEDEVLIHMLVRRKGGRSLTYQFRFYRLDGPTSHEVARGLVTVASTLRQKDGSFKAAPLPTALAGRIREAPRALLAEGRPRSLSPGEDDPVDDTTRKDKTVFPHREHRMAHQPSSSGHGAPKAVSPLDLNTNS